MTRTEQFRNWFRAMELYCRGKIQHAVASSGGSWELIVEETDFLCDDPIGLPGDEMIVDRLVGSTLLGTITSADGSERPGGIDLEFLSPSATFELYQTLYESNGFGPLFDRHDAIHSISIPDSVAKIDQAWLPLLDDEKKNILLIHPIP
jgi:hypothetical protein